MYYIAVGTENRKPPTIMQRKCGMRIIVDVDEVTCRFRAVM